MADKTFIVKAIDGTDYRPNPDGEFLVFLPKDTGLKAYEGGFILLSNKIKDRKFRIQAKLRLDNNFKDQKSGEGVPVDKSIIKIAQIDQKLRQAIGLDKEKYNDKDKESLSISVPKELNRKNRLKNLFRKLFGVQINLARVMVATPDDMEINVCRINSQVMKSIGIDEGDIINIESASGKTIAIRALDLIDNIEKQTIENIDDPLNKEIYKEKNEDIYDMFFPYIEESLTGNNGKTTEKSSTKKCRKPVQKLKLPMLLIDRDARKELGVDVFDPVRVSRSIWDKIIKKMHFISWPLIVIIIGLNSSIKGLKSNIIFYVIVCFILIFINMIEIRQKVNMKTKQNN